jgi:hypothetical protein
MNNTPLNSTLVLTYLGLAIRHQDAPKAVKLDTGKPRWYAANDVLNHGP